MSRYSGWVIAGVVCLIIITLAVTGILRFTPTTTPATSSSVVRAVESVAETTANLMHNVPLKMVA